MLRQLAANANWLRYYETFDDGDELQKVAARMKFERQFLFTPSSCLLLSDFFSELPWCSP
jgi:hypothetical protein